MYQAKLQQQKIKSWKQFCTETSNSNPWNAVYKLAAGKLHNQTGLSTLQTQDGTYTTNLASTIQHLMDNFIPEDDNSTDDEHQRQTRLQVMQPIDTPADEDFTKEEILSALKKFNPKKAPGEDGLNSEILLTTFNCVPKFFTEVYNRCLKTGYFPNQWKRSHIVPITKPGKEDTAEVSKYRPISLLNIGGKLLERLLIDRINHHIYSNNLLNGNQYGFVPQKSTVDAAMAAKVYIEKIYNNKTL